MKVYNMYNKKDFKKLVSEMVKSTMKYSSLIEIKGYYLYSLRRNEIEYKFIFGDKNPCPEYKPSFQDFLKFVRNFKERNPETIIISNKEIKQTRKLL